jgi:hypothetical protein
MVLTEGERVRKVAQNLIELLSSYEEELIGLERETPSLGALRRAIGMAIAEACYVVSDDGDEGLWPPAGRRVS